MPQEITKVEGQDIYKVGTRYTTLADEQKTLATMIKQKEDSIAMQTARIATQQAIVDAITALN